MFKYLRHKTAGAALDVRAINATRFDGDTFVSFSCPVNAMYGETSFICFSLLARSLYNFGIYIYFYLRLYLRRRFTVLGVFIRRESAVFAYQKESVRNTYLWCGDSDALGIVVKRFCHIGCKLR